MSGSNLNFNDECKFQAITLICFTWINNNNNGYENVFCVLKQKNIILPKKTKVIVENDLEKRKID